MIALRSISAKLTLVIGLVASLVLGVGTLLAARERTAALERELLSTSAAIAAAVAEYTSSSLAFGDAEVRIRFDVVEDPESFYFAIRQGFEGRFTVGWYNAQAVELIGSPHELVFLCRGDSVSATLDGRSVPIEPEGRPREGALQFGSTRPGLRIFSIDYR